MQKIKNSYEENFKKRVLLLSKSNDGNVQAIIAHSLLIHRSILIRSQKQYTRKTK